MGSGILALWHAIFGLPSSGEGPKWQSITTLKGSLTMFKLRTEIKCSA
jgi:hypothetical protein